MTAAPREPASPVARVLAAVGAMAPGEVYRLVPARGADLAPAPEVYARAVDEPGYAHNPCVDIEWRGRWGDALLMVDARDVALLVDGDLPPAVAQLLGRVRDLAAGGDDAPVAALPAPRRPPREARAPRRARRRR